jgi:hypothetical protein
MKKSTIRRIYPIVIGSLLILTGVIFLLDNLNIISLNWEILVGPLFALGGLVFLVVFIMDTDNWWALIPGMALIGLGMTIFMDQGSFSGEWSGAVFLGMLALSFWLIYAFHPSNWWAVIPGGVLMTLAVVSVIPGASNLSGGVFFLGIALTFGLLYLLPNPIGKVKWALIPAGILAVFGVLILLGSTGLINYVWPVALLLAGGVVLVRAVLKK